MSIPASRGPFCRSISLWSGAAATAIPAEGVIDSVGCDHEPTADQGDRNLGCMRWQMIPIPGAAENESQSDRHEQRYALRSVIAVLLHECERPNECDRKCQNSMRPLFRRQGVCRDGRKRKNNGSQQTVDHAKAWGPDADLICGKHKDSVQVARFRFLAGRLLIHHSPLSMARFATAPQVPYS